jgi:hypothetical protein
MSALADGAGVDSVASRWGDHRATVSAVLAAGGTSGDGTPMETSDETTPATPAVTMPTLAQVMQWSGQAAKLSGHASQYMNLVNQGIGQLQQMASMAQRGQAGAASAEEVASEEGPESAAKDAERAPIEVAANSAQQAASVRFPTPS